MTAFHTEPPDFFNLEKHYHRDSVFLSVVGIDARFPPDRAKGHYPNESEWTIQTLTQKGFLSLSVFIDMYYWKISVFGRGSFE